MKSDLLRRSPSESRSVQKRRRLAPELDGQLRVGEASERRGSELLCAAIETQHRFAVREHDAGDRAGDRERVLAVDHEERAIATLRARPRGHMQQRSISERFSLCANVYGVVIAGATGRDRLAVA